MKVLQIANDFCNTKVHMNLFKSLDEIGVSQTIFNPVRFEEKIGKNKFEAQRTEFIYRHVVKPWHKYTYHIKARTVYKVMLKSVNVMDYDMTHASTLFTDGILSYKLFRDYHIPYIVAVRNTDINGFMDKAPHTWIYGYRVLLNAEKIIFISKALHDKFCHHRIIKPILSKIAHKIIIKPNGIEDCFIHNVCAEEHKCHKIIYVGNFSSNKNVLRLCRSVLNLKKYAGLEDVQLTLVGGGTEKDNSIAQMISENPETIKFLGPIYDKLQLIETLRSHSIFAMTSIHETFGLVYVEALSQNLAIVYTKGQGVDGMFGEEVGIAVDPLDVDETTDALKKILEEREWYSNKKIDFNEFSWSNIAMFYSNLYSEILSNI